MLENLSYKLVKPLALHLDILFDLLKIRKHTVSHLELPSYEDHINFVKNHPYRKWYIIYLNNEYIGTFYLTFNNSIGLNLIEKYQNQDKSVLLYIIKKFKPLKELKSVRPTCFYINIPINHDKLEETIKDIGGVITQKTYNIY